MPILNGFHTRGYLPHLKVIEATYFITFRLADSLPAPVILQRKERRDDLVRRAAEKNSAEHRSIAFATYAAEVDAVLDRQLGAAWLRQPAIAERVSNALRHFEGHHYFLHAWCVMPNHVHAVVSPQASHGLDSILHSWKSFTATGANRILNRTGEAFWQHESYDHWIRDDTELQHCCAYTEMNPVNARLCADKADWPWSSATRGLRA